MLRTLAVALTALLLAVPMSAQDDRLDDLDFEEVPISNEVVPYFAIGVGPAFTFSFLPMDDINARAADLGMGKLSSPMILYGAEVFSAIGFIPNVRAGFSWMSGLDKQTISVAGTTPSVERSLEHAVSMSAVHVDYAIVVAKGLALAPGIGLGWGTQGITTYQSQGTRNWSDYDSISVAPDMYSEVSHSVIYFPARLNIEYAVTPFIAVRAQAGYTLQVSEGEWKGNRTAVVSGVPSGISLNAFNAQIGLFVGLFN